MEISVSIQINEQCNFKCDHCFYTCGPWKKGVMTPSTMNHIRRIALDLNAYDRGADFNFFGGEPFLEPDVLELAIKKIYGWGPGYGDLFISTNGSFLIKKERLQLFWRLVKNYRERFSLRISNTIWHAKQRGPLLQKALSNFALLKDNPWDEELAARFGLDEYTYGLTEYLEHGQIYIDGDIRKPIPYANPIGRAKKTGAYIYDRDYANPHCFVSAVAEGHPYVRDYTLNFVVHWDGSVGICCSGGGGILGNVKDIQGANHLLHLRRQFVKQFLNGRTSITWMNCDSCREFKMKEVKPWDARRRRYVNYMGVFAKPAETSIRTDVTDEELMEAALA